VVGYQRLRGSLLPLSATGTSETVKGSTWPFGDEPIN
jgi:hypothetical protein